MAPAWWKDSARPTAKDYSWLAHEMQINLYIFTLFYFIRKVKNMLTIIITLNKIENCFS
ncbi:MAG: hypothetical protein RL553_2153 [Planctomycetota bacterium]|jgi:hypothetical protein